MKKIESVKTKAEKQLTPKKYLLGLLISTLMIFIFAWTNNNFSLTFFTNWKILLLILVVSFAFSLILAPFEISAWDELRNKRTISKKKINIIILAFIAMLAFDFLFARLSENQISWSSIIADVIFIFIIF